MRPSFSLPRRQGGGFTLIELLVVISIIAILAGLLLPVVGSVMQNAYKADAKNTEAQIVTAVKAYFTEYGQYPVEGQSPAVDVTFDNTSGTSASGTGLYGHNVTLFDVLRATNNAAAQSSNGGHDDAAVQALNSRQIVYFEGKDVKNVSAARSGFITVGATGIHGNPKNSQVVPLVGDLVDPWGNLYYIRVDANYSKMVENPYNNGTSDSGSAISYGGDGASDPASVTNFQNIIRTDVLAWSPGLDGKMGTNGSNITQTTIGDDVLSWQ